MNDITKPPKFLYKLLTQEQWNGMSQTVIHHTKSSMLDQKDGYIHLSNAYQVERIAKKYFANENQVKILRLDYSKIAGTIKWEPNSTGDMFAHSYGEILPEAIVNVASLDVHEFDYSCLTY